MSPERDIAIIGMAGVFPQAPTVETLWDNVLAGVDAISEATHWDESFRCDAGPGDGDRVYTRRGGWVGPELPFDPTAYGVMPRAVDGGEPEHFVALRLAHEALADAGYRDRDFPRERTAVILGRGTYVNRGMIGALQHGIVVEQTVRMVAALQPHLGAEAQDALRKALHASLPPFNAETAASLSHSAMCGRIANRLDLMGPAYTVDAACASSLIALEQAAAALRSGTCDLALAGGIQISTTFPIAVLFCELGALSRSGRLRSFHPDTDGTLLGEAAGILVLKRLADAERDGDRVYAVVKSVGIASDGRALGILAPRVEGEELAMRRAYEAAGFGPDTIGLVEAHGTGTPAGDATELTALRRVFGARQGRVPRVALGSVKSMIGHSIPAAGVAGLAKAAMALHHRVLPPTMHVEVQPPALADSPLYLNPEPRPWVHGGEAPRRAAVSAFGFGGINAHAVLEEYRPGPGRVRGRSVPRARPSELYVVSAPDRATLLARCEALARLLATVPAPSAADLAFTLACEHDPAAPQCLAIVATAVDELGRKLAHARQRLADPACARIKDRSGIFWFAERLAGAGTLAFLFPGEGAQYEHMLADLCVHFPAVRRCFDRMDRALEGPGREAPSSTGIFPPPGAASGEGTSQGLYAMDAAVEAVFTADQAMLALLTQLGLRPDAVVGHSSGEYSALIAAGAARVDSDAQVIGWIRGMQAVGARAEAEQLVARGTLLAVAPSGAGLIDRVVGTVGGDLEVAMDNCPHQVVLCGGDDSVARAEAMLRAEGVICQRLPFDRAYHTPRFSPFCDAIRPFFDAVPLHAPVVPLWSCVTAAPVPPDPDAVRELAVAQWARCVRFRETVEGMFAAGIRIFVEVGPRGNLTAFVDDILGKRPHLAIAANVPKRPGLLQLHHLLGLLAAHGVSLDLPALHEGRGARRLPADVVWDGVAMPAPKDRRMPLALALPVLRPEAGVRAALGGGTVAAVATVAPVATPARLPAGPGAGAPPLATSSPGDVAPPSPATAPAVPAAAVPAVVPAGGDAAARVMAEYLRGMDDFLATQEAVMQAFLGRGPAMPGLGTPVALTMAPPPALGVHAEVSAPTVVPPAPAASGGLARAAVPGAVEPADTPSAPRDREGIAALLRQLVSERTGYPADMVDFGLHLEADLGIDSIKRVEILGALDAATGLVGDDVEGLTGLKTLGEVADALAARLGGGPAPTAFGVPTASAGVAAGPPAGAPPVAPDAFAPFVVRRDPDGTVVLQATLSLDTHPFLAEHPIGGRVSDDPTLTALPVCPLAMTLEIAAEAAAAAVPGTRPAALRDVRAGRWLAFPDAAATLELRVRPQGAHDAQVVVRRCLDGGAREPDPPVLVCTVHLAEGPRASVAADEPEPLHDRRPARWSPAELYGDGQPHGMFHGPPFRAVASLDAVGADGADATLRVLPPRGLFAASDAPHLALDPVLVDAAGQVLGYWNAEVGDPAVVLFPVAVAEVVPAGARLPPGTPLACHVRVRARDDERVVADIVVVDAAGHERLRLAGWETRRFHLPPAFYRFRLSPRTGYLARPLQPAPADARWVGARFEPPTGFLETDGGIWREAMAHLVLGPRERGAWRALRGPDARRRDWLIGRVVAKDAVRLLLQARHGLTVYPADVEIAVDEHGRPQVVGPWVSRVGVAPVVSLSHSGGIAVAIAGDGDAPGGLGVDLERVGGAADDFERVAFTAEERALLAALPADVHPEWALRCWCAKESVAKALGRADAATPRDVLVQALDVSSGRIGLRIAGELARAHPGLRGRPVTVTTVRDGDAVVAVAVVGPPAGAPEAA